eukprot:s16_g52.t2
MQRPISVSSVTSEEVPPSSHQSQDCSGSSVVWSDWFTDLHAIFRQIMPEVAGRDEITFSISTWFLDHIKRRQCAMPKLVQLTDLTEDWYEDLVYPWRFHIDKSLPVFFSVVAPKQPKASFETHVADVLLTQNPLDMSSVLFTAKVSDSLGPDMILRIASVVKEDITKSSAIQQFQILSQVPIDRIQVRCHYTELEDHVCKPYDGLGITILAALPTDEDRVQQDHVTTETQSGRTGESQQALPSIETGEQAEADERFSFMQLRKSDPVPKQNKESPWDHDNLFLQEAIQQNNIPDPVEDVDQPAESPVDGQSDDAHTEEGADEDQDMISSSSHQNVWLYHLQDPVQLAVISWNRYDAMLRDVATVLRIPLDTLHSLYPMTYRPPYVPQEIEPILVRFEDEIPDDGRQVLCLLDIEVHAHPSEPTFATMPVLRRSAHPLPRLANRFQILFEALVDDYCAAERERCLVFHQGQLWPLQNEVQRIIHNGDYVKIVIPPSSCRHEATTFLLDNAQRDAMAMQRDFQVLDDLQEDLSDSDVLNTLQTCIAVVQPEIIDPENHKHQDPVSIQSASLEEETSVSRQAEDPPLAQCSFTDAVLRAVQLYNQAQEEQPDFGPLPAELAVQSAFVQELFPLWQDAARPGPGNVEMLARVETWFSDHVNMQRSQHTRIAVLSPDYTQWENDLVRLWSDFRVPGTDMQFALVDPTPADIAANALGQISLIQRADPRQSSVIVTLSDSNVASGQPRSIALVMAQRITIGSILTSLSLVPRNMCRLFHGDIEILPEHILRVSHGMALHFAVTQHDNGAAPVYMPNSLITEGFFPSTVPEFANLYGAYPPDWFTILQEPFRRHARPEQPGELPSAEASSLLLHCTVDFPEIVQSLPSSFVRSQPIQAITKGNLRIASTATTWLGDGDGLVVSFRSTQQDSADYVALLQHAFHVPNIASKDNGRPEDKPTAVNDIYVIDPELSIQTFEEGTKYANSRVSEQTTDFQKQPPDGTRLRDAAHRVPICLEATIPQCSPDFPASAQWAEIPMSAQPSWIAKIEETHFELEQLPDGLQVHTETAHALANPMAYRQTDLSNIIELYIDGSTAPGTAAWSLVVVKYDQFGHPHFCGCCAAPVETNTEGRLWIGADCADNISAEFSAVVAAQVLALALQPTSAFVIRPDLQLSVMLAADQCKCRVHPRLTQLVQWLGAGFLQQGGHFSEVRSHQGQPWNELADRLAHFSAIHSVQIGRLDLAICNELVSTNSIAWAWTQLQSTAFQSCLPPSDDGITWKIQPSSRKIASPEVQTSPITEHAWIAIKVVTANVLALDGQSDNGSATIGDRALRLSHQWNVRQCHVVGIQESRRAAGRQINEHYLTIASGADTTHQTPMFGCEIWFHRKLPWLQLGDGKTLTIEDAKITVAHADPRRLIVNVVLANISVSVVVLHAPCKTNTRDSLVNLQSWWEDTKTVIRKAHLAPLHWVCIDANAPLATAECSELGMHGAEKMNDAGLLFEDVCQELRWHVPSTFDWCHVGQHYTWAHPKGTKHRRDYIAVSQTAFPLAHRSEVQVQHDGGFAHEDHLPLELSMQGWIPVASPSTKPHWDRDAFRDQDLRTAFREALESLPVPTWDVNIDSHTQIFEQQVFQLAQQFFAPRGKRKARPRLSEATLNLIAWKRSVLDYGRKTDQMHCAVFRNELRLIELQVRAAVRQDQNQFYTKLIDDLAEAGELSNFKTVYGTLRRLGSRNSKTASQSRALPFLKDPAGNVITTFAQQQMLWMSQFGKLEAGQPMSWDSLRSMHGPGLGIEPAVLNPEVIPTVADFMLSIAKMKSGKAAGPNRIPPEVCKIGSSVFAHQLAPIALKAACHGKEPLSWRGGKLVALHKSKLPTWDPNGYRSIFVSDHTAKLYHSALRRHLVQTWEQNLSHLQVGGRVGLGTDFAHHAVQAHWAHATITRKPAAIIFFDFQAAFYSVIRQGLFQEELDAQGLRSAMHRLGATEDEINELLTHAHQDAALNGIDPHAALLLQDLFRSTFFTVEGVKLPCMTSKGTRPGDPVGDVLFNMSMRLILKDVTEFISQRTSAIWEGTPAQHQNFTEVGEPHAFAWGEIAFVDDCAISIRAEDNNQLLELVQISTVAMVASAKKRGLVVNFDKGKSEVMLNLVGAGTRHLKETMAAQNSEIVVETDSSQYKLRSVMAYRHLGTWIQQSGKQQRDARFRLSLAKQSWGPLVKPFFCKPQISLATKIQVFTSLVLSRYCYNVHTWSMPDEGVITEWNNALRPLLYPLVRKFLRGLPPFQFGIEVVCGLASMLSPIDQLHLNRLRYLQRFLKTCTQCIWNMLMSVQDDPRSWIAQCRDSLRWFAKFYGPKLGLGGNSDFHDWITFVRLDRAWKGRLRKAAKSCIQYRLAEAEAAVWQGHIFQELSRHGGIENSAFVIASAQRWKCDLCDAEFSSKHALATHCTKSHGYRTLARHYARDGRCAHCSREFHTRTRLCAHFHSKPDCLQHHQECFVPLTPDELQTLDVSECENNRDLRQQGWLPTKAILPAIRATGPPLPPLGSLEAKLMRAFWQQRSENIDNHAFHQFAGHLVGEPGCVNDSPVDSQHVPGFLYQSPQGTVKGFAACFEMRGLARLAACLHIKTYCFVHFYSGYRRKGDLQYHIDNHIIQGSLQIFCLSVDFCIQREGGDLSTPSSREWWKQRVLSGSIAGVGGGPPCESYSAARYLPDGPCPLRTEEFINGLPHNAQRGWSQTLLGSRLMRFLIEMLLVCAQVGACGFLEHPAYPLWIRALAPASVWLTQELKWLRQLHCCSVITIDQCVLGCGGRKPTTLFLVRLPGLIRRLRSYGEQGRCNHPPGFHPGLAGRDSTGAFRTSVAKIYPWLLNQEIAEEVVNFISSLQVDANFSAPLPEELLPFRSLNFVSHHHVQKDFHVEVVTVNFDDGPETGLTALTSEDDLCDPRYWKFQEVHGSTPKFKVLFKDGFTSFLTTLPSREDGVVVDEDGDEHRYVQIKELPEAKIKDGDATILRRAPGGYGFIEVVEDAFDVPETQKKRSTKSTAKGGQSKRRKTTGVRAKDAVVSPSKAAEGPSDPLPEAGAVAEGVKAPDAGVSPSKAAEGPVTEAGAEGGASAKVNVEKAKTGRSVCRTCGGGIDKDSVRCGLQGYAGGRSVLLWAHANCFLGKLLVDYVPARRGKCKGTGEAFEIGQIRVGFEVGNHKSWWLPSQAARWTCEVVRLSRSVTEPRWGDGEVQVRPSCNPRFRLAGARGRISAPRTEAADRSRSPRGATKIKVEEAEEPAFPEDWENNSWEPNSGSQTWEDEGLKRKSGIIPGWSSKKQKMDKPDEPDKQDCNAWNTQNEGWNGDGWRTRSKKSKSKELFRGDQLASESVQAYISDIPVEFDENMVRSMHTQCGVEHHDLPISVKFLPSKDLPEGTEFV